MDDSHSLYVFKPLLFNFFLIFPVYGHLPGRILCSLRRSSPGVSKLKTVQHVCGFGNFYFARQKNQDDSPFPVADRGSGWLWRRLGEGEGHTHAHEDDETEVPHGEELTMMLMLLPAEERIGGVSVTSLSLSLFQRLHVTSLL